MVLLTPRGSRNEREMIRGMEKGGDAPVEKQPWTMVLGCLPKCSGMLVSHSFCAFLLTQRVIHSTPILTFFFWIFLEKICGFWIIGRDYHALHVLTRGTRPCCFGVRTKKQGGWLVWWWLIIVDGGGGGVARCPQPLAKRLRERYTATVRIGSDVWAGHQSCSVFLCYRCFLETTGVSGVISSESFCFPTRIIPRLARLPWFTWAVKPNTYPSENDELTTGTIEEIGRDQSLRIRFNSSHAFTVPKKNQPQYKAHFNEEVSTTFLSRHYYIVRQMFKKCKNKYTFI